MYDFKIKNEPFARGFLCCDSKNVTKKTGAGMLLSAKEMGLVIDLKLGLCYYEAPIHLFCNFLGIRWNYPYDELKEKNPEEAADYTYIEDNIRPYYFAQYPNNTPENEAHLDERYLWAGSWKGHGNPDHADVCRYGTVAMKEKIEICRRENPGKDEFYDGCLMAVEALEVLGERFRGMALDMLRDETDPVNIEKLRRIADTFEHAPKYPCRDFAEAVIVFTMVFALDGLDEADSPGHFDQFMYDFWKVTDEKVRESYLDSIWEFFHDTRSWNLTISGSDENWNDLTNDLSYSILKVATAKKYHTPNLTVRLHRNSPEELIDAVYKCLATGCGLPGIYNDEAVVPALERLGIPSEDAHQYVMNGCNQIDIQGKSHMGLEDGQFTAAKAIEYVIHNGRSNRTGRELGLKTGDPTEFAGFDEFFSATIKQLDHIMNVVADVACTAQKVHAENLPGPLRSMLIDGCLEKGREYKNGGPLYGHGQLLVNAFAETVDSLVNVKKYIYEDKRYTMAELVDALDKDFVGYEEMHHTFKNSELKFGNDIEYVDSIARDVMNHINEYLMTIPTYRGGFFSGGCSPFTAAPRCGASLGALPCGLKKAEKVVADSIGATPGCDVNGPTALINSCLAFDHTLAGSGFILNLKFDKAIFNSAAGKATFKALLKSYFERRGQMITVTAVSAEDLKDAQIHPENHKDLIVRVGGYSDLFINLNENLQENVIARTVYGA
ncbi:MAG: hypothetical protein IKV54_08230 [Clostridia bacterium]|nr:hypothetical protein [Clostridia bacterium]